MRAEIRKNSSTSQNRTNWRDSVSYQDKPPPSSCALISVCLLLSNSISCALFVLLSRAKGCLASSKWAPTQPASHWLTESECNPKVWTRAGGEGNSCYLDNTLANIKVIILLCNTTRRHGKPAVRNEICPASERRRSHKIMGCVSGGNSPADKLGWWYWKEISAWPRQQVSQRKYSKMEGGAQWVGAKAAATEEELNWKWD